MSDEIARNPRQHIRVTLTTSILSSAVVAALSAGATWGTFSTRLALAERELQATRMAAAQYESQIASQSTEIAVIKSQYAEILRRLERIEGAVVQK